MEIVTPMRIRRPVHMFLALAAVPAAAFPAQDADSPGRLAALVERLEEARVQAHIPGMSIAIVQGGEVVLARGFGQADIERGTPADASTLFAIGSTTKAFTATVVGMGVDEGQLSWDDPVTKHLPGFRLNVMSEDPGAECTLRDLLSHRHGFVRMSMLWMSGVLTRSEVLGHAANAEPLVEFRKEFRYSNVAYLAAGEAAAAAMGASWDATISKRIFEPLGMSASTVSLDGAQKGQALLSHGYRWNDGSEQPSKVPAVGLDSIAPAGGIYSNANDMARWIQCLLGRGELAGTRVVSERSLETTWTPQIPMGDDSAYGLGWMLHEHRGRRVVEHGGAIDGFTAQVTLLPDERIGYVLLMNLDVSPLREASIPMVLDALLAPEVVEPAETPEPEEIVAAAQPTDLALCSGVYLANFARFRDAKFQVKVVEDRLQVTIPGQGESFLEGPNEDGRWALDITDRIAISFQGAADEPQRALIVHQGAFAFEVPREGVEPVAAPDPEAFKPYVGTYRRDHGGKLVKMIVANGQLVMEDKGNWLALRTPDEDGSAPLRARSDQGATFSLDGEGQAESFVFRGQAGDRQFTRVVEGVDLPSVREILALRGTKARVKALRAARGTKTTGTVQQPQAGLQGSFVIFAERKENYATHMHFGVMGSLRDWTNGDSAWRHNPLQGTTQLTGPEFIQAQLSHPAALAGDWRRHFDRVSVTRAADVGDRKAYVVRLEKKSLPHRFYWVDAETGDVVRIEQTFVARGQRIPLETRMSDFREINGIRTAHRIVHENPATGRTVLTIEGIETGLHHGEDVFMPPIGKAASLGRAAGQTDK